MSFILNIGLNRNDGAGTIEADDVIRDLAAFNLLPVSQGLAMSNTEPTLILSVIRRPTNSMVEFLCSKYKQDCIACFSLRTQAGELIGPKAAEWGAFNPDFFLMDASGARLSQPA